jgi:hypothetical protein
MPAVSPNMLATFTFSRVCNVVFHCCLNEKWVTLFLSMLYWFRDHRELLNETGIALGIKDDIAHAE